MSFTRLFDPRVILGDRVSLGIILALGIVLLLVPIAIFLLVRAGKADEKLRRDLLRRYFGWLILIPLLVGPIALGAFETIVGTGLLSLFCYREYSRATGLTNQRWITWLTVFGIVLVMLAALDHWYGLFTALPSLGVASLVALAVLQDRPEGYIHRTALAVYGYLLFGVCLGHLAYLANDKNYRVLVLLLFLATELNDVFAYCCGKAFGRRKLCPNTSPNKTIAGSLGALCLTTTLVCLLGRLVFTDTALTSLTRLAGLGMLLSVAGQFGDLTLSSIKRDLGIKDMAATIPGHGGLLDRFDSILLAAPVYFHYVHYYVGIGLDQPERVFSG